MCGLLIVLFAFVLLGAGIMARIGPSLAAFTTEVLTNPDKAEQVIVTGILLGIIGFVLIMMED